MAIKTTCLRLIALLLTGACSSIAWAGDHQHRSHDAHVHGLAELTVALEGNQLEIQLVSPAANIVGFEHKAATAEQSHVIEQADATLKSIQQLFAFSGTRCDVKEIRVDMSAVESQDVDHHEHHKDEHKHGHHDHGEKQQAGHSEISAEYTLHCAQGLRLISINVTLLKLFPGIEELNAMWVTDKGQGAMALRRGSQNIYFR